MTERIESREDASASGAARLHYLDWLRVLAILTVFLFHAVHPFDFDGWHVKNAEQSEFLTIILKLLSIWGMPFFFLVAGAGSWFALQKRNAGQYIRERFNRLLVPFFVGAILFSPLEFYCEWMNRVQRGLVDVPLLEYVRGTFPALNLRTLISPRWFGYGFHLWFLGFLFAFALITLPLFLWLKRESGRRLLARLASLSEQPGGILLLILPLAVLQCLLVPLFPQELDWADFVFQMAFFALGFMLFGDQRFLRAIRKDWWLLLAVGTVIVLCLVGMHLAGLPVVEWSETPGCARFYVLQALGSAIALCYSLTMLFVGMRFLDFTNSWLRYAQQAVLPFFVVHQPVIIVIALFVVQWNAGIWLKLPIVVLSSFIASIGLYELIIRRIRPLRLAFGMKD